VLYVTFYLGHVRYALDTRHVVEILPLLELKRLPGAVAGIAGLCIYRGNVLPVIDLSALIVGNPAERRLSTRLLVVRHAAETSEQGAVGDRLLGLLAENALDTLRLAPEDFVESGVRNDEAPSLGDVASLDGRLIQRVELHHLLTPDVRDVLFNMARDGAP